MAGGVIVLVAAVLGVLAYPAWSAARGGDARWVVDSGATTVLDYDDERILALDGEQLLVLDRETDAGSSAGRVDWRHRVALVPGGVVASADGRLTLTGSDGRVMWEKQPEFDLVAVEAGLAVAALSPAQNAGPSTLTAFALEDGAPVWTMPEVARVGTLRLGTDPVRPAGCGPPRSSR